MKTDGILIQGLASNLFWLIIVLTVIAVFRNELRNLLNSLGSFKVAGASFELKDSRSTLESYVILTNIMIDTLSQRETALKVGDALSDLSLQQLTRFAITYAKSVPEDVKQIELVKNVAAILGRRGDPDTAKLFYDALLEINPRDLDVLNLKANSLGLGDAKDILEAEKIQDGLIQRRPKAANYRFNRAITKAKLGKTDEVLADLDVALDEGFWERREDMLTIPEFREYRSIDAFKALSEKLEQLKNT